MSGSAAYVAFPGRLLLLGFGTIGRGLLPLVLRHIDIDPARITVLAADADDENIAAEAGVRFVQATLTRQNYREILERHLGCGDFLINVSVNVGALDLIALCQQLDALYLDTSLEPWPGDYTNSDLPIAQRTNYWTREQALALRAAIPQGATAVIDHGANPGLVSHFVKRALLDIAADTGIDAGRPADRREWAMLAAQLGVRLIQIAERDTQVAPRPKRSGEFVNTWSIEGFYTEGAQPAELGWGTHERHWPADAGRHEDGCGSAIYLQRPGVQTYVRTWTPRAGPFHGLLISHEEAISIADYFTLRDGEMVVYRPTVHFAYHPCDDALLSAHEFAGRNLQPQDEQRLLMEDITRGIDELGVLLAGHARNAYWYGSQLSVAEARELVPHNNATSLQVTAAALAGAVWAIENPRRGIVEPDEIDFDRVLDIASPYLGPIVGRYTDWTPLQQRGQLFPEPLDETDPWQFLNVRVD